MAPQMTTAVGMTAMWAIGTVFLVSSFWVDGPLSTRLAAVAVVCYVSALIYAWKRGVFG